MAAPIPENPAPTITTRARSGAALDGSVMNFTLGRSDPALDAVIELPMSRDIGVAALVMSAGSVLGRAVPVHVVSRRPLTAVLGAWGLG